MVSGGNASAVVPTRQEQVERTFEVRPTAWAIRYEKVLEQLLQDP